jgi:hypothetical protein
MSATRPRAAEAPAEAQTSKVEPPPEPPERTEGQLSMTAKLIVFLVVPLTLIALAVALAIALWPAPVHLDFREEGAPRMTVSVPDARIDLLPSGDGRVHVEVTGWYSGRAPEFSVRNEGDQTVVRGACRLLWLSRCSLTVAIALPEDADVFVAGTNGNITATRLTGELEIGTTNGALDMQDVAGTLSLRTTNGSIRVAGGSSSQVFATTTNGQIQLEFAEAPAEVLARTTNGGVTVRVPDGGSYFVDANTTNGDIDTSEVPSDREAASTITAETTNGGITVEHTG